MTTVQRRRGKSLHLDLSSAGADERPPLSALFLIKFDVKAGYTIVWKRAVPGLELSDSVEFKSLPSGLHNVPEDLVYFMHGDSYAGISAFVNTSSQQWERNALMIAVGALVPLEYGRLGRSWRHAPRLKELAKGLAADIARTEVLEQYWTDSQPPEESHTSHEESQDTPNGHSDNDAKQRSTRAKSMSSANGLPGPTSGLAPMHPAFALPTMLHTFGALIFPLYKAALLRKRILLVNEAPVELACNFVYNISIISNIPSSVMDLIPLEPLPYRLQPLFSVGVHDIDEIAGRSSLDTDPTGGDASGDSGFGWVACTTDNVLAMKQNLFDVLVNIPSNAIHGAPNRTWPSITTSGKTDLKASQRDLRRYRTLRQCQKRSKAMSSATSPYADSSETAIEDQPTTDDTDDQLPLLPSSFPEPFDDASSTMDEKLIEPLSWSALAYNSFMWWASAGEKRTDLDEEAERDAALWRDFNAYADAMGASTPGSSRSRRRSSASTSHRPITTTVPAAMSVIEGSAVPEMAIIGYFHRVTVTILGTLAAVVDQQDGELREHEGGESDRVGNSGLSTVYITGEDMARMGLDVWSDADQRFVEELVELYWGRHAEIQGGRIECCGVRIL